MLNEDNSGFINFPENIVSGNGKTLIYLVAFAPNISDEISNVNLSIKSDFVSDDMIHRPSINSSKAFDDMIMDQIINNKYDKFYFPSEDDGGNKVSISLVSCICIGWSNFIYSNGDWVATFRDLTYEGTILYYSMKKLHNNKEVRILTFNN